jgi:hypothetical protein
MHRAPQVDYASSPLLSISDESHCPPRTGSAGSPTLCGGGMTGMKPVSGPVKTAGEICRVDVCEGERSAMCMLHEGQSVIQKSGEEGTREEVFKVFGMLSR